MSDPAADEMDSGQGADIAKSVGMTNSDIRASIISTKR
jgi:hypothetical protein